MCCRCDREGFRCYSPPVVDTGDNTLFFVVLGVVALAGTALIAVKAKKEF